MADVATQKQEAGAFEPVTDPTEPRAETPLERATPPQTTLHLTTGEGLKVEMVREDVLSAVGAAKAGFVELANDVHVALAHIVHF